MVLPDDVWLVKLSGNAPYASTSATGPVAGGHAPAAASARSGATGSTAPGGTSSDGSTMFNVEGYTYSQAGVARFMTRLAVVPDFENVQLLSSEQAQVSGRTVYHFQIGADIRQPGATS
jgi:Tfp pilus assembly protein PilN